MLRKIIFFINTKAGKHLTKDYVSRIAVKLLGNYYDLKFISDSDTGEDIYRGIINYIDNDSEGFYAIVGVGGDGTINTVARIALERGLILGIIPAGSGNGLARAIKGSFRIEKCLEVIKNDNVISIDVGEVNGINFICTAGIGFDAYISYLFNKRKNRGIFSYIYIILKELFRYRSQRIEIEIEGMTYWRQAFIVSVANINQYGYNFYIAPRAKYDDGLIDLVVIESLKWYDIPGILYMTLTRRLDKSSKVMYRQTKNLKILMKENGYIQYDGEGKMLDVKCLNFSLSSNKLKIFR